MAHTELGTKRSCTNCGARFYDLGKMPVECPKCEASFVPEILLPPKEPRLVGSKPYSGQNWTPRGAPKKNGNASHVESPVQDDADDAAGDEDDEIAAIADAGLNDDDSNSVDKDADDTLPEIDSDDDTEVSGLAPGTSGDEKAD